MNEEYRRTMSEPDDFRDDNSTEEITAVETPRPLPIKKSEPTVIENPANQFNEGEIERVKEGAVIAKVLTELKPLFNQLGTVDFFDKMNQVLTNNKVMELSVNNREVLFGVISGHLKRADNEATLAVFNRANEMEWESEQDRLTWIGEEITKVNQQYTYPIIDLFNHLKIGLDKEGTAFLE